MRGPFFNTRDNVMKALAAAAAATALMVAGAAHAQEQLAQASGCLTCHSVSKKIVGPAFKDVAAKYRNDKSAEAKLVAKVKNGGKGVWGDVPMPPNAHVKDEDIRKLVHWVLSLK
jgi:cytochrome c